MWNAGCSKDWYPKREFRIEKNVPCMQFRFAQRQRSLSEFLSIPLHQTCSSWCPCVASGGPSSNGQAAREGKRVLCDLLAWRLWRLSEIGSYFNVDVKPQHGKAFGFGTTNWGLNGGYYVRNLLEIQWHLKNVWVSSDRLSGGVHLYQFVPQKVSYKFHLGLCTMFCIKATTSLQVSAAFRAETEKCCAYGNPYHERKSNIVCIFVVSARLPIFKSAKVVTVRKNFRSFLL